MHLAQSVMDMTGSPPEAFTPSRSNGATVSLDLKKNIAVASPTVTLGAAVSNAATIHVTTSGVPRTVVALALEIKNPDGACAALKNIPFEVTGNPAREVTFNSEHQKTPWGFCLKINAETEHVTLSFTLRYSGLPVDDALVAVTFYEALARGGEFRLSGSHPVTGGDVFLARANLPSDTYEAPDPRFVRLLHQMAFIQGKTGVPFVIPDHNIGFEEANTIAGTANILKTGHAQYTSEPWVSISSVEQARSALESFGRGSPVPMALHFEGQVVVIFGTYVPLGPVTFFCDRTYIAKEDLENLRKNVASALPGSSISIRFTPLDACPIEARYLKWLPDDEAAAISQLPMYKKPEAEGDQDKLTLSRTNSHEAITLLKSWYDEDPDEQKKSWEQLRIALDEDRLSHRKLF